ncbi:MAG: hypothetical protein K0S65_1016 [Labilithrix sp.]|nr:hypothetical protein [Labilithrix sp.]
MSPLARTLPLLLLAGSVFGCDSSAEHEDCVYSDDPGAAPGSRRDACVPSGFPVEKLRSREIGGLVRRGEDLVAGAVVRVDSSPGFAAGMTAAPAFTVTDSVGYFGGLRTVAFRYDLSIKLDQSGADLLFYQGLAHRYFEPSIEGPRTFARAWASRFDVTFSRPIPDGHSVGFFVSGDGIYSVTGDRASGLVLLAREYSLPATLHAVEYETARGFEGATAYGKLDVMADAGRVGFATVALAPIEKFVEPQFAVTPPPGYTGASIDVFFGYSRTSAGHLASIPFGGSRRLPLVPNAGYTYRVTATSDGAVSDSGEVVFDVTAPLTQVEMPTPPVIVSPLAEETRGVGEPLLVSGEGVFEHVLVPQAGGPSMRILSAQHEVALPDGTPLAAAHATGPYTWTVRSYPKARFVEAIGWLDTRRYQQMGVTAPRSIVLR